MTMDKVTIKFKRALFIPPASRLQFGYLYFYDLIHKNSNVESKTIGVFASDVLSATWSLDFYKQGNRDAEKILLQFAKKTIVEKFKEGTLNDSEEVVLLTSTQPAVCPYDPKDFVVTEQEEFTIEPENKALFQEIKDSKLAASIIETRDIINALFSSTHGERLLLLDQERNLLDFFKSAISEEQYSHRIASLGQTAGNINASILRKVLNETDTQIGSIALLDRFLVSINKQNKNITEIFKHIRYIRKGYPIHGDNIRDVIYGYKFFKLKYPVENFETTWTTLLNQYLIALKQLYEIFSSIYSD
jgi:hypothetical protein